MWDDYRVSPLDTVLDGTGNHLYAQTFRYLVGEPIDWSIDRSAGLMN